MACGHGLAPELSRNPHTSVQWVGPVSVNLFCQKLSPLSIKHEAQLPHCQPPSCSALRWRESLHVQENATCFVNKRMKRLQGEVEGFYEAGTKRNLEEISKQRNIEHCCIEIMTMVS